MTWLDHTRAPVLEALEEFRRRGDVIFGPPGHQQGRGVNPRVLEVMGEATEAFGCLAAEVIGPYPPGVPVVVPGEVIEQEALDHLLDGVRAGMLLPDAADPQLRTVRVVRR
jgi:arginine/lysine/ornithine decarboxylase